MTNDLSDKEKEGAAKWREEKKQKDPENYFTKKLSEDFVDRIDYVRKTIMENFPKMWEPVECALSALATLFINDISSSIGINFQGSPSSEKTTVLSFLKGSKLIYWTDSFTPKSFVSHAANVKKEILEKVDLLPRIKDKGVIIPELSPIFGKRKEDLIESLSILTRVFDGQGLETDSGIQGHRGYSGDYRFVWLGATTPIDTYIWRSMGKLGQRWMFYNIPSKYKTFEELLEVMRGVSYIKKVEDCRKIVTNFLNQLSEKEGIRSVFWERDKDDKKALEKIIKISTFLVRLRAYLQVWENKSPDGQELFNYKTPIFEEPERCISTLYDICRGRAILYGRHYICLEDTKLALAISLSSMPYDRAELLQLLIKNEGILNSEKIEVSLNCSKATAHRIMKTLEVLGLVIYEDFNVDNKGIGRPNKEIRLKEEFRWLLDTQSHFSEINSISQENDSVCTKCGLKNCKNLINGLCENCVE